MRVFTELVNIATCLAILGSLWIRRNTWHLRWEQPKTIGLAFIAGGVLLKGPPLSWLLNDVMHGLYLLVAHIFVLCGIASIAYGAEHKIRSEQTIRRWHITFIVFPWNLGVAVMVGLFTAGAHHTLDQLFQFPPGYTTAYWITYDILTIYLLGLCAYSLWWLIYDKPSRVGAGIYLGAVGWGLVGATCRALLATVDDGVPNALLITVANTANAIALSMFAFGAALMWTMQQRHAADKSVSENTLNERDKARRSP